MKNFILSTLLCLIIIGCGNVKWAREKSLQQITAFHSLFNEDDFTTIIENAHPDMFTNKSQDQYARLYSFIKSKLGKSTESVTESVKLRTAEELTIAVVIQKTKFERGHGTEMFTFSCSNGQASLLGYNITSQDLLTPNY